MWSLNSALWGPVHAGGSGAQPWVCVCLCAGQRAGTAETRALKYWERAEEGEDKASGVQVCAQMCVVVVEET